ncbi:hypothetical protein Acsp02_96420 [Actinoplanes sp. NBRC 103695]|nr:hypothetical protein Acsp02_96420 [Actinoplanes sp. NBRC 103695]
MSLDAVSSHTEAGGGDWNAFAVTYIRLAYNKIISRLNKIVSHVTRSTCGLNKIIKLRRRWAHPSPGFEHVGPSGRVRGRHALAPWRSGHPTFTARRSPPEVLILRFCNGVEHAGQTPRHCALPIEEVVGDGALSTEVEHVA